MCSFKLYILSLVFTFRSAGDLEVQIWALQATIEPNELCWRVGSDSTQEPFSKLRIVNNKMSKFKSWIHGSPLSSHENSYNMAWGCCVRSCFHMSINSWFISYVSWISFALTSQQWAAQNHIILQMNFHQEDFLYWSTSTHVATIRLGKAGYKFDLFIIYFLISSLPWILSTHTTLLS